MVRLHTREDVAAHVEAAVRFGTPGTVGVELEWLAVDRSTPGVRPRLERVRDALADVGALPGASLLSIEPGGQVELSSAPLPGPGPAVRALTGDVHAVRDRLEASGVGLTGLGADPLRPPVRLVRSPRYDVMEAFWEARGSGETGRQMMCSSAAVQVSLDAGTADAGTAEPSPGGPSPAGGAVQSARQRWLRAHAIGPALVAAFACSPLLQGAPTGWSSTRQRFWRDLDPSRTHAPAPGLGPVESLTELALTARLMTVRDAAGTCLPAPRGVTFADWLAQGSPTTTDLDYHLTTLFPPVRLRGWLELRYLDALPDGLWQVAVAVCAALLDDDLAADAAREACAPVEGRWTDAARLATADTALATAATACLLVAADALPRLGAPELVPPVLAYAERFSSRGRCPADDLLEAHAAGVPAEVLLLDGLQVAA